MLYLLTMLVQLYLMVVLPQEPWHHRMLLPQLEVLRLLLSLLLEFLLFLQYLVLLQSLLLMRLLLLVDIVLADHQRLLYLL
ncbi:hypothetical protein D3C76_1205890 [compost metagenome]